MKIEISTEFYDTLIDTVTKNVIQVLQETNENDYKANELPLYPNRKQVKKIFKIEDNRLNQWIDCGLKVIPFGKEIRFDLKDIQNFLNQQKL